MVQICFVQWAIGSQEKDVKCQKSKKQQQQQQQKQKQQK